jgi:hypothetical protein
MTLKSLCGLAPDFVGSVSSWKRPNVEIINKRPAGNFLPDKYFRRALAAGIFSFGLGRYETEEGKRQTLRGRRRGVADTNRVGEFGVNLGEDEK